MDSQHNTMDMLPEILTAQNIADYLHISRKRVYELFQLSPDVGGIPSFSIGASKRAEKSDFIAWIAKRRGYRKRGVRMLLREKMKVAVDAYCSSDAEYCSLAKEKERLEAEIKDRLGPDQYLVDQFVDTIHRKAHMEKLACYCYNH